jgi:Protein of unknown function (DUF2934)
MAEPKERRNAPRKTAAATSQPDSQAQAPSEETRRRIAEAAYFRAKQRGFEPGHELEDWVEAESEVMGRLNGGRR